MDHSLQALKGTVLFLAGLFVIYLLFLIIGAWALLVIAVGIIYTIFYLYSSMSEFERHRAAKFFDMEDEELEQLRREISRESYNRKKKEL